MDNKELEKYEEIGMVDIFKIWSGIDLSEVGAKGVKIAKGIELACKIGENFNNFMIDINKVFEKFDINKFNKTKVEMILKNNEKLLKGFIDKKIWPPIFYNDKFIINVDVENLKDLDLKEYYLESIRKDWIKDKYPDHIKLMINEIADGYDEGKIYTTTFGLFTLLEYRLSVAPIIEHKTNGIYPKNKEILQKSVIDRKEATDKFLNYIEDVMFKKTTDDDIEMVSRHVVHGHRLDLVSYEGMMSWIFLYDFVDKTLKIDETKIE